MSKTYFGTDGIRGVFGSLYMNETFAFLLGKSCIEYLKQKKKGDNPLRIIIGRDTRVSGEILFQALVQGILETGGQVVDLGVVPTAAVSLYLSKNEECRLGIMISASHNPASDNGFKFFKADGCKLTLEEEKEFENVIERMLKQEASSEKFEVGKRGLEVSSEGIQKIKGEEYFFQYVKGIFESLGLSLKGMKVAIDAGNGATYQTSPATFEALGAEVILFGNNPDGYNINTGCGSEHPERIQELVKKFSTDIGIAHDGDGDRLVVVDEQGSLIGGDELLGILALGMKRKDRLVQDKVIITIQSNMGLDVSLLREGIRTERVDVGDRNVVYRMLETKANLGGESSGHIIFSDYLHTGDGLIAACQVLAILKESGKPLSELRKEIHLFPQLMIGLKVRDKKPLETLAHMQQKIQEIEHNLGGQGRLLVRYSGTESKLRLLVEAPTDDETARYLRELKEAALKDLEVIA